MEQLGWHWLGEVIEADPERLRRPEVARELLCTLSDALALTQVQPPVVRVADGRLVAVVLLAESHASLHVPPQGEQAFVDVFSCGARPDGDRCAEIARHALGAREVQHQTLRRGPS